MDVCGYLIVRWLVEEQSYTINNAFSAFSNSFPNGITNPNIVEEINKKYLYTKNSNFIKEQDTSNIPIPSTSPQQKSPNKQTPTKDTRPKIPVVSPLPQPKVFSPTMYSQPESPIAPPQVVSPKIPIVSSQEEKSGVRITFDEIGEPVDSRLRSKLIMSLNVKFQQFRATTPMTPISRLTPSSFELMTSEYCLTPKPHGIRCLLYIAEDGNYLIQEKNKCQKIELKLYGDMSPEKAVSMSLFEGYLVSIPGQKPLFVISDLLIYFDNDIRQKPGYERLSVATHVVSCTKKYSNDIFSNMISIDVFKSFPLTSFEKFVQKDQGVVDYPISGILFYPKDEKSEIGSQNPSHIFEFKLSNSYYPAVKLKVSRETMVCVGTVDNYGSDKEVVEFGVAKPNILSMDECIVDIQYNRTTNQWQINGRSNSPKEWTLREFRSILDQKGVPNLTLDELEQGIRSVLSKDEIIKIE
ncbi:hypothetical protein GPJ56_004347 [Histomonas meleagridis]|uniref:uncharacterized protein n=1 Tax=Histomonas meleagridis TaxID=135588 RepID=UPI00355A387B|nr:hypothetical protein GPJ56_004347 [Histomonas meleagridis]KAH0800008.1 hypothetical protein GO595_007120 [Histomonas meleagridis]